MFPLLLLSLLAATPPEGAAPVLFLPRTATGAPDGFTALLSPAGDPDRVLSFPAGQWVTPPPGDYWAFLEGPETISPWPSRLDLRARDFSPLRVDFELVDSGRAEVAAAPELAVHLFGLDSHRRPDGEAREIFSRRLVAPPFAASLPVGRAFAAVYSPALGSYLALSPPFAVAKGLTTSVRPSPPRPGRADLLLILERPEPMASLAEDELRLFLQTAEGWQPPAVLAPSARRFYAVWYDLPAGPQRLRAFGDRLHLADRIVELRPGEVGQLTLRLGRRPDLEVRLDLPPSLRRSPQLRLELRPLSPPGRLARWILEPETTEIRLERLPPADAEIQLQAPPWAFSARLDLSSGKDAELRFAPRATELRGYLLREGERASGKLRFRLPDQDPIEVETDSLGRYEIDLWRRGLYEIGAMTAPELPSRQYYDLPEVREQINDLELPTARYVVRAFRRGTRRPVPIARAFYRFHDREDRLLAGELTIEDGQAPLPPFGPGRLDLWVAAKDHVERELLNLELPPDGPFRFVVAQLEPVTTWTHLRLEDQDEAPIEGAQLRIYRDGFSDQLLWQGKSDEDGDIEVPGHYGGRPALVRAPGFAFHAEPLPEPAAGTTEWQLARARPEKANLVVVDRESRTWAGAELWLGLRGLWLRGAALAWLTGGDGGGRTDLKGQIALSELPPDDLFLLAAPAGLDPEELPSLTLRARRLVFPPLPLQVLPLVVEPQAER